MADLDLDIAILTFNCARTLIDPHYLAQSLHSALAEPRSSPPDILVLALEELAPIAHSFLSGTWLAPWLAAFTSALDAFVALHNSPASAGAPSGPSSSTAAAAAGIRYEQLASVTTGMTGILLYAQPDVARSLSHLEVGRVRTGDYELGNKGAAAVRVTYTRQGPGEGEEDGKAQRLAFVAAHLAPHEMGVSRRNADWRAIAENLVFEATDARGTGIQGRIGGRAAGGSAADEAEVPLLSPGVAEGEGVSYDGLRDKGIYAADTHLFVAGDLNYRTSDAKPSENDHERWPAPSLGLGDDGSAGGEGSPPASFADFSDLWAGDQLKRELAAGRTLHGLKEAEIRFAPTYKYSDAVQERAKAVAAAERSEEHEDDKSALVPSSAGARDVWAQHRQPSWTDRILFASPKAGGGDVKVKRYDALRLQPTSDHRPVVLHFGLPIASGSRARDRGGEEGEGVTPAPSEISPDWAARRTRSRRKEVLVGVLAYATTTWEGGLIVLGTVVGLGGAWALVSSFL